MQAGSRGGGHDDDGAEPRPLTGVWQRIRYHKHGQGAPLGSCREWEEVVKTHASPGGVDYVRGALAAKEEGACV